MCKEKFFSETFSRAITPFFLLVSPSVQFSARVRLGESLTNYTNRRAVNLFSCNFTGEGSIGYLVCDSAEHRGQRLEQRP